MAALALDDLMDKKKEPPPILDLSQSVVNSKEELDQLLAKVPEYKIRPEKVHCLTGVFSLLIYHVHQVKPDEMKIRDKDFTFKMPKSQSAKPISQEYK
jgi:hypothetical protein